MKLAIVADDPVAADVLAYAAERRGHQTVCIDNIDRLFGRLPFEPSVVVVSGGTADEAGLKRLSRVKAELPGAALFVTLDHPSEPYPAQALRAGAQEVVREPYNPYEVVLRAEAWLAAHASTAAVAETLTFGDIEIALERYYATKAGQVLPLTKLELRLLYCLCEHQPHLAPMERLLTFGWDTLGDPDASLLKTHISHIRKKLQDAGGDKFEIVSRQTVGYVMRLA